MAELECLIVHMDINCNTSSGITYDFNSEKFTLDIRVPVDAFEVKRFCKKRVLQT